MSKQITISYEDNTYILEYTRDAVRQMEAAGFSRSELTEKPMTMITTLFAGAFLAHHRTLSQAMIDTIYATLGEKKNLVVALTRMYDETIDTLMFDEPEGKNVGWKASW